MRGRRCYCADQQTRHQTDRAYGIARQKRAAERDPEAEYFCRRRNVGVGNVQTLEQGHGHCARQVAGHAEARYQQQDGNSPRPEPAKQAGSNQGGRHAPRWPGLRASFASRSSRALGRFGLKLEHQV